MNEEQLTGSIQVEVFTKKVSDMLSAVVAIVGPLETKYNIVSLDAVADVRALLNGDSIDDEILWGLIDLDDMSVPRDDYENTPEYEAYLKRIDAWYVTAFQLKRERWYQPTQRLKSGVKYRLLTEFKNEGRDVLDGYKAHGFPLFHYCLYGTPNVIQKMITERTYLKFPEQDRVTLQTGQRYIEELTSLINDARIVDLDSMEVGRSVLSQLSDIHSYIKESVSQQMNQGT